MWLWMGAANSLGMVVMVTYERSSCPRRLSGSIQPCRRQEIAVCPCEEVFGRPFPSLLLVMLGAQSGAAQPGHSRLSASDPPGAEWRKQHLCH